MSIISTFPAYTPSPEIGLLDSVNSKINSLSSSLREISLKIHANPELNYKEYIASSTLTEFLTTQRGWTVKKGVYDIETAFLAEWDSGVKGAVVSFNSEYDALPNIGHACGHNLIAIASLGGAMATAAVMEEFGIAGKVILVGTPAEEGGGGKIKLIDAGLYRDHDIDVSLMAHPVDTPDAALCRSSAISIFKVEFFGKAAHAAMNPYQGVINALDAMVAAFSNIGMLRQQSKPGDFISGFITNGGSAINVIPAYTSAAIGTRAPTKSNLNELDKRVYSCCEAGALASGAKLNFLHQGGYEDHVPNSVLADLYRKWFNVLGGSIAGSKEDAENGTSPGGTDQGNVSHVLPSLHALFQIEAPCGPHQLEFAAAAKADGAHERAIRVAKALALTALDILLDKKILEDIKKTFVPDIVE